MALASVFVGPAIVYASQLKKVYPRPEVTSNAGAITPGESHDARLYAGSGPGVLFSHPLALRDLR